MIGSGLRRFYLDVNGMGAVAYGEFENGKLFLDAAVELPVILVPAASGDNDALRELVQKGGDGLGAFTRVIEEIQAKFQELFAGIGLAPGVLQHSWNVWHA